MHGNDPVVDLAATAEPLPTGPDSLVAALERPRLVDATDRLGMGVFLRHQSLALVAKGGFIPLDRFEQPL